MREVAPSALVVALVLALGSPVQPAAALPPPAIGAAGLAKARWVEHRVIPGERVKEIADRYGVRAHQIAKWNKLDPKRIRIRAGQKLRLYTRSSEMQRERVRHTVRRGDSWHRIARKYGVDAGRLRKHWNRKMDKSLRAGDTVIVWVERDPEELERDPEGEAVTPATPGAETAAAEPGPQLPTVPVAQSGHSVGSPSRGRLIRGVQMPDNPALYTVRNPAHAYGSSHTVTHLQNAIAQWRRTTGFDRELVIADMSRKRGGRFRPHRSHRSGRDVDIRLPLAANVAKGTVPHKRSEVDWDATWGLIHALLKTGQVEYIFLSRNRQNALRRAALRAGVGEAELARLIQFPNREPHAVVRHSRGHTKHIHVRFRCGPGETRCRQR